MCCGNFEGEARSCKPSERGSSPRRSTSFAPEALTAMQPPRKRQSRLRFPAGAPAPFVQRQDAFLVWRRWRIIPAMGHQFWGRGFIGKSGTPCPFRPGSFGSSTLPAPTKSLLLNRLAVKFPGESRKRWFESIWVTPSGSQSAPLAYRLAVRTPVFSFGRLAQLAEA